MKARLTVVFCLIMALALSLLGGIQSTASPSPAAPPPPGELTLSEADNGLQIELAKSEILVLSLESNPATGYAWEVQGMDQGILLQVGEFEFESAAGLLGGSGTQTLRFVGVSKGQTPLELVYRRPWEADVAPLETYSVDVLSKGTFAGDYNAAAVPVEEALPAEEEVSDVGLPSSFNWCDQGGCTPVKDQGSCGSCWAFGTVGPFECNIKIVDGVTKNLAEQYLVSCNSDGWGCGGGWWAHDYHEWKYVSGEPEAGAVYEADFPYTARDDPCNPPHPHHEKIENWVYVGNDSSVPSVSAMKQAIYDYGPISVAVCANSAMSGYGGGIFTGPSCTSVNHAVVLVGWDDTQGSNGIWYMRNSWGKGWGESGYMRIEYGVSRIGYSANYVVYGGSEPTPTPTLTPIPTPTLTPTPTPTPPTPTPTPTPPPPTMHVDDIQMSYVQLNKTRYEVSADITIKDEDAGPVDGATVSAQWTLPPKGRQVNQQQVTGATGVASFSIRSKAGTYQICVTDVTKAGWIYDPSQNVKTCETLTVP